MSLLEGYERQFKESVVYHNEFIWPQVFLTGVLDREQSREAACADGLMGWANCMAGAKPIPDNFGKGMAAIGAYLNIMPTPEELSKYGDKILAA